MINPPTRAADRARDALALAELLRRAFEPAFRAAIEAMDAAPALELARHIDGGLQVVAAIRTWVRRLAAQAGPGPAARELAALEAQLNDALAPDADEADGAGPVAAASPVDRESGRESGHESGHGVAVCVVRAQAASAPAAVSPPSVRIHGTDPGPDVYDQLLRRVHGIATAPPAGGDAGLVDLVLSQVSVAAGRYFPPCARRRIDADAAREPQLARVLEAIRAAGFADEVRLTVDELHDLLRAGIARIDPAAFAASTGDVRALAAGTELAVRFRPARVGEAGDN